MREIGFVDKSNGGYAWVRVAKKSACGENCASCKGGCTPGERTMKVKNPIGASVGDRVAVELSDKRFLLAAFLVYILPLIMFLAGFLVSGYFFSGELLQIVSGLAVAGCTVLIIGRIKNADRFMAEITQVFEKDAGC